MTAVTLPNVGLKSGFLPGEGGWNDEVNQALRIIDALMQARVLDKDLAAPPGSPAGGDTYIVAASPTGAWAGQAGKVALWQVGDDLASAWVFLTPKSGWRVYVVDEGTRYQYNGSAWIADTSTFSSFSQDIGDGSAATFTVNHALGTKLVHVSVFRNAAPYEEVGVDIKRTDNNNIEVSGFAIAPSAAQFKVYVSK